MEKSIWCTPKRDCLLKENDNTYILANTKYFPNDYNYNGNVLNFKNTIKIPYIKKGMNMKINLSE